MFIETCCAPRVCFSCEWKYVSVYIFPIVSSRFFRTCSIRQPRRRLPYGRTRRHENRPVRKPIPALLISPVTHGVSTYAFYCTPPRGCIVYFCRCKPPAFGTYGLINLNCAVSHRGKTAARVASVTGQFSCRPLWTSLDGDGVLTLIQKASSGGRRNGTI